MILGILAHPRVTVIDVRLYDVLVDDLRHDDEPLGQEVGAEAVVGAGVGEVDDQLEGFVVEGLEGEQHVVDEQVSVDLANSVRANELLLLLLFF